MSKHYNLTITDKNGKSITTTNVSTEYPEELVRMLTLAGSKVEVTPVDTGCGCGSTPCGCGESVEEETEYQPTPANDKLDLDDFSKKTANSISKQKKRIQPSHGDNPLEYSVNEDEIYDALMADAQEFGLVDESFSDHVQDFGMFSKEGNAQVQNMIQYILNDFEEDAEKAGNNVIYALRMDAIRRLFRELEELGEDPKHEEATDTDVRERAAAYLDKGMTRIMNILDKQ